MSSLPWLSDDDIRFPDPASALREPNGLLAAGGSLTPERLLEAYRKGIFPWYEEGQPVLWWSPDPRMVLFPDELHISRSLARTLRLRPYRLACDTAFRQVMTACAGERRDSHGTWITPDIIDAYCRLHDLGIAHSIEAWEDHTLVGGLYGLVIGDVFFGESMFSHRTDASKVAFADLVLKLQHLDCRMIDCQVPSTHLASFGAREIPRREFLRLLSKQNPDSRLPALWPLQYGD